MAEHDHELTRQEQGAFAALPREIEPPAALEDRVVSALAASGAIRRPARQPRWLAAAAAAMLFAAGYATAAWQAAPAPMPAADNRYALLLYDNDTLTDVETADRVAEYSAWARDERAAGRLELGEKLADAATFVGPTPDASGPSGLFIIRADSLEEALTVARDCPHARHGGTIVVRRVEATSP